MTLEELRRRLGISTSVAYELANRDELPIPTIRIGRRFLFSRAAFAALLTKQKGDSFRTSSLT
jgi:excisionase family DNA binding protein